MAWSKKNNADNEFKDMTSRSQGTPCGDTVYADSAFNLGYAYSAHVSSCKKCKKEQED